MSITDRDLDVDSDRVGHTRSLPLDTYRHLREVDAEIGHLILVNALNLDLLCALLEVTAMNNDCGV